MREIVPLCRKERRLVEGFGSSCDYEIDQLSSSAAESRRSASAASAACSAGVGIGGTTIGVTGTIGCGSVLQPEKSDAARMITAVMVFMLQ